MATGEGGDSALSRLQGWLREQAHQLTRSKCPWCGATPVRSEAEMVVFTNSGYRFPLVSLTYCLICEQLLYAELATEPELCGCRAHVESDIAESDTLPLRNPHRITDIVFDSCARCGKILDCSIHY